MTAQGNQSNFPQKPNNRSQAIVLRMTAVFFCGLISCGIQHPAISTWVQGTVIVIADKENLEQLKKVAQKRFQKAKNWPKLRKRNKKP
ncbi:MAG: hypothetical protein AB4426_05535 [Xenococcaceae cyanobacterium]